MINWRFTRNATAFSLWAFAGLIAGAFVIATIDKTVIVTEEMVVIPGSITSTVWSQSEQALISDLDDQALYQGFDENNAAFIDVAYIESLKEPKEIEIPEADEVTPVVTTDVGLDDTLPEEVDTTPGATTTTDNSGDLSPPTVVEPTEPVPEVPVVEDEPVEASDEAEEDITSEPESDSQPEPEPVLNEEVVSQAVWGFPLVGGKVWPLAQEVITTYVNSSPTANIADTVEESEVVVEDVVEADPEPEIETTNDAVVVEDADPAEAGEGEVDPTEETVPIEIEEIALEEVPIDDGLNDETTDPAQEGEPVSNDETLEPLPEIEPEVEVPFSPLDLCVGVSGCDMYPVTFSGFEVPEFESGKFLSNVELRLSLAAKRQGIPTDNKHQFVVEYGYGEEITWRTATIIDIEDEVSNSLNGGYFLVALDRPLSQGDLATLQVRVSYVGVLEEIERAYIESVWLEVTSASFYEEGDPYYNTDSIAYERDLLLPSLHELETTEVDIASTKLPRFTLSYSPQQGFLRRVANELFSENTYKVESVQVINSNGELMDVPIDIDYQDDSTWTLSIKKHPQKMLPGKYRLLVTVNENESLFRDEFEFYWGVLAVNTTKTRYFPDEEVVLNLAALTNKGDTICDAILTLKVISPEGVITEVPVEQSGSCGKNNVTDVPDYLAYFKDTKEVGDYTIQLQHFNQAGELVHKIEDFFAVAEYIPFDIERTAPTRIYPPAPYKVALKVTANRSFTGDIVERVPRGFAVSGYENAEILTLPDYTEIVWSGVDLSEGEKITLEYTFDAPDISPYLYLLGPLEMDGFSELRQWQIASDALTAIANFTGTRTVAGTNLNQTASPLQWSTSSVDTYYYDHSTSTNSHVVTLRQSGDYFLTVNLPQQRTDGNNSRTRVGVEVRVNGVTIPEGLGRSGYIRNQNGHAESSSHAFFLLNNISANDTLEVYAEGLTTIDAGDVVNVTGQASLSLEYIEINDGVFSATTTQTTNSTNLNQATEYAFSFVETRQDTGFVHSDSINPEQIVISDPGVYYVSVNIPMTTSAAQTNVFGRVRLDGAQVAGGQFKQGYSQSNANEGDGDSSMHWSGVVVATTSNQVLTVTAQREAAAGTVTVTSGSVGTIFVRALPSTEVLALRGTTVVGGTNWNPVAAAAIEWASQDVIDSSVFSHSTSTNNHQITINEDGDYFLSYNDALNNGLTRGNSRVQVVVNGSVVTGAETKSHYIRNQSGHADSSGALALLVEGLQIGDIVTVTTEREASTGTLNDSTDGVLLLWKKAEIDFRPDAPSMYNTPFDNIRFASTTPYFDFSALDPDGTSDIEYEFSIATTTSFAASSTYSSVTDSEFFNTASSTDASPFLEGNRIRFQLEPGDALTDLTTYYWRVRARDVDGSGEFGDWSTTQSLTVDMAAEAPSWFQSYSGQFEGDSLVGTVSSGADKVQVDASVSPEVLLVYGEGTVTTPRYRFWDGATWGLEGSATAIGGTLRWAKTAAGVSRDEYALVTLDSANDAYAQIYSASTSSWGNSKKLSEVVVNTAYRGAAVAYESLSGDAMAVSCTNSPDPVYSIWDGTSWSATSTINVSSLNNCNFIEIASDPASDEIILVVRDTGTQYEALVWDGTTWVESIVLGASALVAREGMSVIYETSGDQAVVVVSNNTLSSFLYTTWNGVEFSSPPATQPIGDDFEFGRLTADPESDELALCYIDTDDDIGVLRWNGGVWNTFFELDTGGNIDTARPIECSFETSAGRSDYLMAAYSDTVNVRYRSATSTSWSTEQTIGTMQDSFWVQTERAGDGTILAVALDDVSDNLNASFWNGTSWAAEETLETNLSSVIATPYEIYDLTAKRFQFSEGVVETPPIDFSAVPNQPTWGDVSFETTEPFGTDVLVRIRYTSTTTCDAYIPDGVLAGNSAGFDVSDSPIDLTAVSTTTYDQICLEATLTTIGSDSAALEEWALAWVRQPKLTQNNYRWYVNGSFLTPTDPWPAGSLDVAENESLDSDVAVNIDDAIRLRLSLQGENVELPAFSEAFKLQYAEGLNCSNSLTWSDVGDPASTTALWRGYENSIVGDDWYSASWGRRIKLTVSNTVVEDDVTDFPVYVDLSDLPSGFFSAVQSDGDDIRITGADGITELPFELVAIDTGLETGELHFKANLASTTDSEFYIYYSNSGASGYAASAAHGSRNVWTNSYSLRYALDDSPAAASPQFRDSTSNNNNAVAYAGMSAGDVVSGQIGQAIDLDGNDGGTFQTALAYAGQFTASVWWNSAGDGFAIAGPAGANEKMGPWNAPAGTIFTRTLASSDVTISSPADSTWAYVVLTRDAANKVDLHVNGTTTRLYADVAQSGTSDWINFGGETTQGFIGQLDELRFSSVRRTNGWIRTEFNNQSNPTGFYAVSGEELISDGRFIPTTLLTESDYAETYEEENPTRENQNSLPVGDDAEWDFVLQNNAATEDTYYCFRLVYEDGSLFNTYNNYPRVITNAPPLTPVLTAPFDNERLASTSPWFEFTADDELGDEVAYQIQVSTDAAFGSTVIDSNSISNFALFTNLSQPSQKSTFTPGQTIQYIPSASLTNGNTYWWRVRAEDPDGSGAFGTWSTPNSFTVNTGNVITTWFQTTGEQFATNDHVNSIANTGSNDTGVESGFSVGTTTSSVIDYDDRDTGNAWGSFSFTNNVTSGSIEYFVEYRVAADGFALIPDVDLPGNSSGFNSSPISLVSLDTTTYNELRLVAVLSGNATLPRLQDWTVTWSETIEIPTHVAPFDNAKVATTTPELTFVTSDPENDSLQYELQISSSYDFSASSTFVSGVDSGFLNTTDSGDTSPFDSNETIRYTVQSPLTNGNTYWWRARARDPGGSNSWSDYSTPQSFTVDTAITTSVWYQTTGDQFLTNELSDIEVTAGAAQITSTIEEVMTVYGEGTGQSPQYRLWNGDEWGTAFSAESVSSQIRWLELKASPTRPEYALGTLGTDLDVNFQIYDATSDTWADVQELQTNSVASNKRTFNLSYETISGDLLAIVCDGTEAVYSIWNGTTWSSSTAISLSNANNCEYIAMASDPVSDEIIAVFRHTNTGATDYEALVWNGSSWGNSSQFGNLDGNANEGMAVAYEESGNDAVVVVSNNPNTTLIYNVWSGSSWDGTNTHALGDRIEWATLKSDVGTDRLALCYQDNDTDVGVVFWDGGNWGTNTELDIDANGDTGRSIDCEFETTGARDGYLMVTYSDTLATRYQSFSSSTSTPSGELSLDVITDTFEVALLRSGDGLLHFAGYDDALTPDRIDNSQWNGSLWSGRARFSDNASLNGVTPYIGGMSQSAQLYPNFTNGTIHSTPIDFADGSGPRWESISFTDSTPGSSAIEYQVYYESSPGVFSLIPDVDLPGNSTGFTISPIDISNVSRYTYSVLQLEADLLCDSGDCPVLQDWSVAWSEGVTFSGVALEYDGIATTTSGTVAVAVNGTLQAGKTGTILGDGTWSIANVTVFPGDTATVFVDGAADTNEAIGIATYDGVGNVTGMELRKRHVTLGYASVSSTTNAGIAGYDNTDDEDIFYTVGVGNALTFCVESGCSDGVFVIKAQTEYIPSANTTFVGFRNYGTFSPATNTVRVGGDWNDQGTFNPGTSQVIFTATSSTKVLTTATSSLQFYNVTFGESSGSATWSVPKNLSVLGNLAVSYGTVDRATSTIDISGNLVVGSGGSFNGIATTTFIGTGSHTWSDAKSSASSSNVGRVVIDGTAKTVTLAGNVAAQSVTIGADDTLNSSGSGYNLTVYGDWTNSNSFIPQNGTVTFVATSTATINRGSSAFNNLSFNGAGGNWSFTTATLAVNGNLTIATGTVTLPTGTTTIAGSFNNSGGSFLHNNGEVRMTSTASGRTITQSGTAFLNAFYDLVFSGSGGWTFSETAATTTRDFRIQAGTVTFPSGSLTVGGDLLVTGTGAFSHNNGEVRLLVQDADSLRTNGSSLNNLRIAGGGLSSWYNDSWQYRIPVTIEASQIDDVLTNFPVLVDLDDFSAHFFSNAKTDGGDIRVTAGDGVTELAREIVSFSTAGTEGELYFKADTIASSTDTIFYVYYGNSGASDYAQNAAYGENNVWSNGYVLVEHLDDLTTSSVENSEGSPDGTKTSANNPLEVTAARVYESQDISGDSISHTDILGSQSQMSFSAWFKADSLTGSGDTATFGYSIFGISPAAAPYTWLTAGGTGNLSELRFCAYSNSTTCPATSGAGISTGNWYYVSVTAIDAGTTTVRVNGTERASFTNPGDGTLGTNFTLGDLRPARNINFDGQLDEVRVSNVVRTNAWRDAEYRNMATTTDFYTVGGYELPQSRTFTDTNATILGNLTLDTAGDATFPAGVLSVGGSFSNNAQFYANGGTVRFNSSAGSETIDAGDSSFATLDFNHAAGDFTISENATATVAVTLTSASQFTVANGRTLASAGTFTNALSAANTTWTGATLRLMSGGEVTINAKTHAGDTYGTLEAASSTLVKMWNSSATSYVTSGTTGAIYSQDHAGVDGDLTIYGNYSRTTGTEYWSYATDFDGTALASTSRQVDVRVATSSTVGFTNASLNMVGGSAASTTVDAISGAFSLSATNTTITAEFFTLSGTDSNGLELRASTTLSVFRDGYFTVAPSRSGITIDASTVDHNPAAQFYRISFATSSPGAASNVTLSGSPSSFVWFREGGGGLYGENYDNNDANPGSLRFDDSSNSIIVSGTVYADAGLTTLGGPTCDGVTANVRIVVDGGTYASSTSCNGTTGAYSFPVVNYVGDPKVLVYLDTNGGVQGSVITKTPTSDITDMHIYANRVVTRHEDVLPLSASDMQSYDYDNDTDLRFVAATTSLEVLPNTELHVFASTTFAPEGNITLLGNGNSNSYEGTLALGTSSVFIATGTETHTLAGRLVLNPAATLTAASSTFIFNATTTGKSITSPSSVTLHNLTFNGVGGGWNIGANLSVLGDMEVASGTVTGTGNISVESGELFGNGVLSLGAGTTTIARTNTLGGTTPWTFYNLALGNGSVVGTTTPASSATTTILGMLTIANAHFLDADSSTFDLAGTGTVLNEVGTFLEDTSTIRYSGTNANVRSTGYYNLVIEAGASSSTYTAIGSGISVLNDLTIGGEASSTLELNTSDILLVVSGDVQIAQNGTLEASNSANLSIEGDFDNNGVLDANGGTIRFTGSGTSAIAAGLSSFATVEIDGTGTFTVVESATATAAWRLINHDTFTLASGQTLSVGGDFLNNLAGADTVWTGSNLYLFGTGTYDMNDSATSDSYETLTIASGTHARMWNSEATAYAILSGGSLYSQDHEGNDGELYIYGQLIRTTGDDFWSYDTDFDGTDLSGGSERVARVYLASGASATWTGGSLSVIGTSTATTTIANQGSGTYSLTIAGTATTEWDGAQIRDVSSDGISFSGTPTVTDFSRTDHLVEINSATAITVAGSVINANEAKSFTTNVFEADTGVTGASNVTVTGTAVSSWRFTNHTGDIAGESFDVDPDGDPGYVTWDDSASLISVSGTVYSDESGTLSSICDGVTNNIRLVVANDTTDTTFNTTCSVASSTFTFSNVGYSEFDELVLYIVGESEKATTVTTEPISSINNLNLYENRVVVRHESTNPLTIERMSLWDSSDDAEIQFTAVDAGTDTLTIPANRKLLIWTGKTFEPNGNVTLSGGGGGAAYDGTLEAQTNAYFIAQGTEVHSIGGSLIFGTNAQFTAASSTVTLTTSGASRTIDVNTYPFHNLSLTGSGSYVVTDSEITLGGSYTQSAGTLTLPSGTTTIGAAFNVTSGTVNANATPIVFTGSGAGNTVRFNGATVGALTFNGSGSWNMTDTNATTSGSLTVTRGGVTLPSGNFAVGGSFRNTGGTITHNTSDVLMGATTTASVLASTSNLYGLRFTGGGTYTLEDTSLTLVDSLVIDSGSLTIGTGTLSVGGSFTATGGSFTHASGTVLFNATAGGRSINPGTSSFYNLQIGAPAGGYTLYSATTTNNLTIASVSSLTVNPGSSVTVGGVFLNSVGGAATTWTNSTLRLIGTSGYSLNTRSNSGDTYGTLELGPNTTVRMWYSNAATTTTAVTSSLYSQDHSNVNGALAIYGNFVIATTTEHWSYATDFDGTSISGTPRAVTVSLSPNATTTVMSGTLNIVGSSSSETVIQNQGSGTHSIIVNGGTLNANWYTMTDLDILGLQLNGLSTITNLANGLFDLSVDTGALITLSSTTLNANPSKIFDDVGFTATTGISGYNVALTGETANAWRFTNNYGNIGGEGFDVDGIDACGSVRFDDSSCLLTEQTHARWRQDNGGEGAPDSEWFDLDWDKRKRVRILNEDNQLYASTAVKVSISYESSMQSDFEDLRFTSDDGVTEVPFWVERYTASTDAQVWVRVPELPANDHATVFMYYGNGAASSTSNGTSTFDAFDDFEDASLSEYSGDTGIFTTVTSPVFGGTRSLGGNPVSGRTTDGIFRFDQTVAQGDMVRYMQYVNAGVPGNNDEPCALFGVQSPGTTNQNYAVCLERFGVDRLSLSENVTDNDVSGTVLASTTVTYSTGWYEVEIDWQTNNLIVVNLYNSGGTLVASTTASDSSYTSGGYGFTYWYQNGAWDSFTARARVETTPTIYFGAEQEPGGADWLAALDAVGNSIPNTPVRLRVAVENSGLDITAQQFRLEFAAKDGAPTCESVAGLNYATVPNQASCGSSPVCMATSSQVSNGAVSTDLLFGTNGTFTAGEIVTSPSTETTALDIDQDYYTEIEYALMATSYASDNYCFRVTNAGTELDFYGTVAELGLQFDPSLSTVALNDGLSINLTPGTTTIVIASSTVVDMNGAGDIAHATATIYRSGVGPTCSPDANNCYVLTTENGQCSLTNCSGNSCALICEANIPFHADPTDIDTYEGQEWIAYAEVEDTSGGYDFDSAPGVELITLRALQVDSLINYGALEVAADTGSDNATTTITNLGNVLINVDVEGTDLTDGESSAIPAEQQKVATTTFSYSACVSCYQLSSSTPVTLDLNLSKPTTIAPPVETEVYWGIAVPFGTNSTPHTGTNIFTAIGVD